MPHFPDNINDLGAIQDFCTVTYITVTQMDPHIQDPLSTTQHCVATPLKDLALQEIYHSSSSQSLSPAVHNGCFNCGFEEPKNWICRTWITCREQDLCVIIHDFYNPYLFQSSFWMQRWLGLPNSSSFTTNRITALHERNVKLLISYLSSTGMSLWELFYMHSIVLLLLSTHNLFISTPTILTSVDHKAPRPWQEQHSLEECC